MTLKELLDKVQEEKPNSFTQEKLVSFVNEVEYEVAEQLHEDFDTKYTTGDMNTTLMAIPPYDKLYVSYVKSQIDLANEEIPNYQNDAAQHVQDFRDFVDFVVREQKAADYTFPRKLSNIM